MAVTEFCGSKIGLHFKASVLWSIFTVLCEVPAKICSTSGQGKLSGR